jgi:predicted DNA-binding transcriptional regulator AlpA
MAKKPAQAELSRAALSLKKQNQAERQLELPLGGVAVLRRRQVLERLGISNTTLYDWVARGVLPPPLDFGPRTQVKVWLERDIDAVLLRRARERDERVAEAGS